MSCGVSRDVLWAWVHEQDADAASDVGIHVSECPACQQAVAEMRSLEADLRALAGADVEQHEQLPERIGGYRIVGRIGQGGMGTVYDAEQSSPRRRVALKVIRSGAVRDDLQIRLFQREVQTLARLNHPLIASIYDAGVTDEGMRYFAMERIEGVPLDAYAAGRRPDGRAAPLPLRERLMLLARVCEAIGYAHQRGVIHRDLKPANILVLGNGSPKVLDFGLARVAGESGGEGEAGRVLGTPAYMSPEQTLAEPDTLDVRCDVYALGVILFELCTGRLPYDLSGLPMAEALRIIAEQPPLRPRSINPAVPAEIEDVILKALRKDPEQRYASVAELGEDVRRYLEHRPISARPATAWYRLRKALRRHRVPAALLSAIFVLVAGSAVMFAVQNRIVARERDIARFQADKFQRINDVLTSFLNAPNAWQEGSIDMTVKDVLDGMARRIADELGDTPLLAAAIRHTLGLTYRMLSDYEHAEQHLRFAYETRRERLGEDDPETLDAENDLGELAFEAGRVDQAERLLADVLEKRRHVLPPDDPAIAETLNSIGLMLKTRGRFEPAERRFDEALKMRERYAAAVAACADATHKQLADAYNAVAQTHNNLGALYRARAGVAERAGDAQQATKLRKQAEVHYLAALNLRRRWLGEDHPEVAKMLNNYAKLLIDLGRPAEAEARLRESVEMLERNAGQRHAFTARAMYNLASLLADEGQHAGAVRLCREALAIQQEVLDPDHRHLKQTRALLARLEQAEQH